MLKKNGLRCRSSNTPIMQEERDQFLRECGGGNISSVRAMMEEGRIPQILDSMNRKWNDPLKIACENGHLQIVMYLLSHGTWKYDHGKKNDTLLHIAAANGHAAIVKYLLEIGHGIYINSIGNCRRTPLHCACKNGYLEVVKLLVEAKANIEAKGPGETTPLSYACHHGNLDIVKYLEDQGGDLCGKLKNQGSNNALHWACLGNTENKALVEYLLSRGADPNGQNRAGFSPLHLAVSKRHANIVQTLLKHGALINAANGTGMHAIDTINPYCVQDRDTYNIDACQTLVTLLLAGSILPDTQKSYIPSMMKLLCIWAGNPDTTIAQQCMVDCLKKRDTSIAEFLLTACPSIWSVTFECENFLGYNQSLSDIEKTIELLRTLKCEMPRLKTYTVAALRKHLFLNNNGYSILGKIKLLRSHLPPEMVNFLTLTDFVRGIYPKLDFCNS